MKKSTLFLTLALAPFFLFAQWTPSTTSIDPPIHRTGSVGIGLAPAARLHIGKAREGIIEIKDPSLPSLPELNEAHIRLTTNFVPDIGTKIWEIDGSGELQFRTDATASNQLISVMGVNDLGLRVNGPRVAIGGGGQQVNVGFNQGHYLAFGFRPFSVPGMFQNNSSQGGSLVHADDKGDFKISTFLQGTDFFNLGENTRLTVTSFGNVGIGTEDPQTILHLESLDQGLRISNWQGGGWDLIPLKSIGAEAFGLRVAYDQQPLWVMKKDGRMGIGTQETPNALGSDNISAYRLFVEGGILSKEVRVRTVWADHVFEPAYRLASLPEVEAHIHSHGRLPDTPSAAHIESSGLELGSMTVLQQVKIEELFLHIIALEKRVAELEEQAAKSAPRKTKRAVGAK
jgi:hypothetical protein